MSYLCNQCGKSYIRKKWFEKHLTTHTKSADKEESSNQQNLTDTQTKTAHK